MLVSDQEVQFGAFIRLRIAVYAQTIEFICQHLLCAQAATNIIRQVFSCRHTRIVKVIIRKEGTIMAVDAIRFADEQFQTRDLILCEYVTCFRIIVEDGFYILIEARGSGIETSLIGSDGLAYVDI